MSRRNFDWNVDKQKGVRIFVSDKSSRTKDCYPSNNKGFPARCLYYRLFWCFPLFNVWRSIIGSIWWFDANHQIVFEPILTEGHSEGLLYKTHDCRKPSCIRSRLAFSSPFPFECRVTFETKFAKLGDHLRGHTIFRSHMLGQKKMKIDISHTFVYKILFFPNLLFNIANLVFYCFFLIAYVLPRNLGLSFCLPISTSYRPLTNCSG